MKLLYVIKVKQTDTLSMTGQVSVVTLYMISRSVKTMLLVLTSLVLSYKMKSFPTLLIVGILLSRYENI